MALFHHQAPPAFIGVVHLPPLPGSPTSSWTFRQVLEHAKRDAQRLVKGGVDGLIIENFGDAPFVQGEVEPTTIAFMTRIALEIKEIIQEKSLGINVLRNDASGALAVAAATEAEFIRVNIHTGVMATDQGLITGRARETLLQIKRYELNTKIAADVHVKHATPLADESFIQAAKDTWHRGHANAIIVTGSGTGQPVQAAQLKELVANIPNAPLWIGSGLNPDTIEDYRGLFHAAIIGTWLHEDGILNRPVDTERVRTMRRLLSE